MVASESVFFLLCCVSFAFCGLVEFHKNVENQRSLDQNMPVSPILHSENEDVATVKEKRCPRVGSSSNIPSNIVGAVNPATLDLKDQVNKQLCKSCKNRHTCKHLNNCESCSRWCDSSEIVPTTISSNEIASREETVGVSLNQHLPTVSLSSRIATEDDEAAKIPYTIVTLQNEPMKNTLSDLLGLENKADIDTLGCWVTTFSNNPPIISGDTQEALKSSNPLTDLLVNQKEPNPEVVKLADTVRQKVIEGLEGKIKDFGKDVLTLKDIDLIIKEVDQDFKFPSPAKKVSDEPNDNLPNIDLINKARSNFEDEILPRYPLEPRMDSVVLPQSLNPDIIEGPPDMTKLLGSPHVGTEQKQDSDTSSEENPVKENGNEATDSLPAASNNDELVQIVQPSDFPSNIKNVADDTSSFRPDLSRTFENFRPRGFELKEPNTEQRRNLDSLENPQRIQLDPEMNENLSSRTHKLLKKLKKRPQYQPQPFDYYRANKPMDIEPEEPQHVITEEVGSPRLFSDSLVNPQTNSGGTKFPNLPGIVNSPEPKQEEISSEDIENPEERTHTHRKLMTKKQPHYPSYSRANEIVEAPITDKILNLDSSGAPQLDLGDNAQVGMPLENQDQLDDIQKPQTDTPTNIAPIETSTIPEDVKIPQARTHKLHRKLQTKKGPHSPSYYRANEPQIDLVTDKTNNLDIFGLNGADQVGTPKRNEDEATAPVDFAQRVGATAAEDAENPEEPQHQSYRAHERQEDTVEEAPVTDITDVLLNSAINNDSPSEIENTNEVHLGTTQEAVDKFEENDSPADLAQTVASEVAEGIENPEARTHKHRKLKMKNDLQYPSYYRTHESQNDLIGSPIADKNNNVHNSDSEQHQLTNTNDERVGIQQEPLSDSVDEFQESQHQQKPSELDRQVGSEVTKDIENPEARTHKLHKKLKVKKGPQYPSYYRSHDPHNEVVDAPNTDKIETSEISPLDYNKVTVSPIEEPQNLVIQTENPRARTHKLLEKLKARKEKGYPTSYFRTTEDQVELSQPEPPTELFQGDQKPDLKTHNLHKTPELKKPDNDPENEIVELNKPGDVDAEGKIYSPDLINEQDELPLENTPSKSDQKESTLVATQPAGSRSRTDRLMKKIDGILGRNSPDNGRVTPDSRFSEPHSTDNIHLFQPLNKEDSDGATLQEVPPSTNGETVDDRKRTHKHLGKKILRKKGKHLSQNDDTNDQVGSVRTDSEDELRFSEPDSISDLIGPNILGQSKNDDGNFPKPQPDSEKKNYFTQKSKDLLKKLDEKNQKLNQYPPNYYKTAEDVVGDPEKVEETQQTPPGSIHDDLVKGFKSVEPFAVAGIQPDQQHVINPVLEDEKVNAPPEEFDDSPTQLLSRLADGDDEEVFKQVETALGQLKDMSDKLQSSVTDPTKATSDIENPNPPVTNVMDDVKQIPEFLLNEAQKTIDALENENESHGNASEIVGSQPLENSFELYRPSFDRPYRLQHQNPSASPTSYGLVGAAAPPETMDSDQVENPAGIMNKDSKEIYFVGHGIKLPLHMVKQDDGAIHLAVDVDKLCSCRNISCRHNHSAIEDTVGTILEKEAELKDLIPEDQGDFVLGMAAPKFDLNRFSSDSGELQHENPDILKRSLKETTVSESKPENQEGKLKDGNTEEPLTTHGTSTGSSAVPQQEQTSPHYWRDFISQRISDIKSSMPNINNFDPLSVPQDMFKRFVSGEDNTNKKDEIKIEIKEGATTESPSLGVRLRNLFNQPQKTNEKSLENRALLSSRMKFDDANNAPITSSLGSRIRNFFSPSTNEVGASRVGSTVNDRQTLSSRFRSFFDRSNSNNENNGPIVAPVGKGDEKYDLLSPVNKPYQFRDTEKEFQNSLKKIDETIEDYNKKNGEIIKQEADTLLAATENATVREEVGIMNNFLTWLRNVVTSNKNKH